MIFDTRVSEVLAFKGSRHVWTLPAKAGLVQAIGMMREHAIGCIVVSEGDEIVGVVSERECLAQLTSSGALPTKVTLGTVARDDFPVVNPNSTARECFELMAAFHARYIPVVDEGQLEGLVSIGDIVRALVEDQRFTIEQLMSYITGSYGSISHDMDPPSTALEISGARVRLRAGNE